MKKIVLLLTVVLAVTFSASAQKLTKEEKAAQKAAKEAQTAALLQKLFSTHSFKFIPESYEMAGSQRNNIDGYQECGIRPDSFRSEMTGTGLIDINRYEIVKEETVKNGYTLSIKIETNGAIMTWNFFANSRSGQGTLRVKSNRNSDIVYNGTFREF